MVIGFWCPRGAVFALIPILAVARGEIEIGDRSLASKIESRIKRMSKTEKTDVRGLSERIDGLMAELAEDTA